MKTTCVLPVFLSLAVLTASVAAADSPQPNLLLLFVDNVGYGDLGCYGNRDAITPRIDRLASEGVRCLDFYIASPSCSPSRGAILTGRHPERNGLNYQMSSNPDIHSEGLPITERILPEYLKPLGYQQARVRGRLLILDVDLGPTCNLACLYCDRSEDIKAGPRRRVLTLQDTIEVIREGNELGAATIEFPGAGEPLLDDNLWPLLSLAADLSMVPVVYTNGLLLTDRVSSRLHELGVSVVLKVNSLDASTQDALVGRKGYHQACLATIQCLLRQGFAQCTPTRLGFDVSITPSNYSDISALFSYCRKRNIFPFCSSLIPHGRALAGELLITRDELLEKYQEIQRQDAEQFGIHYSTVLPTLGGYVCNQIATGCFVDPTFRTSGFHFLRIS